MSVKDILYSFFHDSIHLGRINSLTPLVESIICTKKTNLTPVGRDLSRILGTQERSCIRRVLVLSRNVRFPCKVEMSSCLKFYQFKLKMKLSDV